MTVRLLVAPSLRLFLPARSRATGVVETRYDGTATVGHLVQAAGIPLTEVGGLAVDGRSAARGDRPRDGDEVAVGPVLRPQPLDGPARLLLDVHLGALARRLRLLGVDTRYDNEADDDRLVATALTEDRVLLTQDRRLLMRRALRRAAFVRGASPDEQVADVLDRFALPLAPYSRCTTCSGLLHEVQKGEVEHLLEPGTRRTQERFWRCEECGRVYWHGAHARRLDALVRAAAGP